MNQHVTGVISCQILMTRGIVPVLLAALFTYACSKPLPPIPTIPLEGLDADVRTAIEKARADAAAQPRSGQASGHLGMVLQAHALDQPAALAYQRAMRLDPREFSWPYYLSLSLQQTGQIEPALAAVTDALRLHPDYAPAMLERAELLLKLGRFQESSAAIEPLLQERPDSALALYDMGRVKFARQDFAAADDFYRRAVQAYPKYGAAWFGLAETSKRLGHGAEAEKDYALAEGYKDLKPPADDPLLTEVHKQATGIENRLRVAKGMMDHREFDRAAQLYREVLKQYPDNLDSLVNLIYLAQFPNQSTPQEVEELYARAYAVNPKVPELYMYHGTALAAQGKYDAAVAELEKAIQLKPNNAEAHAWLADVSERRNRLDEAIAQYRIAIQLQPDLRIARIELGKDLLHARRSKEAIPVLLPTLQVEDKDTPVIMMFLVQAYVDLGDRATARKYLEQAHDYVLRNGPSNLLPQIESGLQRLGAG